MPQPELYLCITKDIKMIQTLDTEIADLDGLLWQELLLVKHKMEGRYLPSIILSIPSIFPETDLLRYDLNRKRYRRFLYWNDSLV